MYPYVSLGNVSLPEEFCVTTCLSLSEHFFQIAPVGSCIFAIFRIQRLYYQWFVLSETILRDENQDINKDPHVSVSRRGQGRTGHGQGKVFNCRRTIPSPLGGARCPKLDLIDTQFHGARLGSMCLTRREGPETEDLCLFVLEPISTTNK